jgi:hypothetical protein
MRESPLPQAVCSSGKIRNFHGVEKVFHAMDNFFHAMENVAKKFPWRGSSGFSTADVADERRWNRWGASSRSAPGNLNLHKGVKGSYKGKGVLAL